MSSHTAVKCFTENLNLFADPKTQPEKYNLYQGLRTLAEAVAGIESQVGTIQADLADIRRTMQQRTP